MTSIVSTVHMDILAAPRARTPVWLDCDPGHDDAFAILLAALHPRFRLLGISTTYGNASLERTTDNALRVLTLLGLQNEIPVYRGAHRPFSRKPVHAPEIHGESGLDGTELPEPGANARDYAIQEICRAMSECAPGLWYIIATGPLTNIALCLLAHPEFKRRLGGLCIMGGAIGDGFTHLTRPGDRLGNWTPTAEFNIYCDPESAKAIFEDEFIASRTFLITLDLTHQFLATPAFRELILRGDRMYERPEQPSRQRQVYHDLLVYFAQTYATQFGFTEGPPLHDVLAVAVVLDRFAQEPSEIIPRMFPNDSRRYVVSIDTNGRHGEDNEVGRMTVVESDTGQGVRIPRSCNAHTIFDVLNDCFVAMETVDEDDSEERQANGNGRPHR